MKSAHDLVLAAKTRITEVDLSQAEAAIRDADLLIDVREADEYSAAHIPGAINIPRGLLEFKLSNDAQLAERTLKLVLYCKNSGRSALAADALREMGYRNVLSLAGGIEAWQAAGRELLTPTLPAFD
ncbi:MULTISPECIES: rhodanese-like domain-containing protein [Pseudomonadaceae]|jgi:rhodanese-related sulfurtransferase|uniref:Sulfurtransferase n=3 Tax=Pseudomonadaceae TaxID=135621 RepID=A0A061CV05_ECTOL|nr:MULTISPECIES: rhodanese-like domain-containing protein [Pseudomonas]MBP8883170.1 sulfurtransferase [Pseudomonas sp.]OWK46174.1 putative adenylyltransferase/sulfurtransferase MoeZ [Pseudomonas oleovorans subsp. oleovorans]PTU76908.1 sulfurtransferase [Pseudomonas indoloxydans]QNH03250.1 sulfurtransferase [Pseudomonas sediminis]CDM41089.1 rhodanese domain-containing protein [Pseudomonas oleovorans CECT 5344]